MIKQVFGVYDLKAEVYGPPYIMSSLGEGTRFFSDLVNDGQSFVAKHPADFQVYVIGTFDDVTGVMQSLVPPKLIGLGTDFLEKKS